jgi:hypothetical protein
MIGDTMPMSAFANSSLCDCKRRHFIHSSFLAGDFKLAMQSRLQAKRQAGQNGKDTASQRGDYTGSGGNQVGFGSG